MRRENGVAGCAFRRTREVREFREIREIAVQYGRPNP